MYLINDFILPINFIYFFIYTPNFIFKFVKKIKKKFNIQYSSILLEFNAYYFCEIMLFFLNKRFFVVYFENA